METLILEMSRLLNAELPELGSRIQPNAVDYASPTPYLAYTLPEEQPIHTIHGVAGYYVVMDIAIVCNTYAELQSIINKIVATLDRQTIAAHRFYLQSLKDQFFQDEKLRNLHGKILKFKIK
ncbi:MAG: hypothetical protein SNH18_09435 [Rikenellaceae bacterium]